MAVNFSESSRRIPPNVSPGEGDNICSSPDDDDNDDVDDCVCSKLGIKPSGEALVRLAMDAPKLSAAVAIHPLCRNPAVSLLMSAELADDAVKYAANAEPRVKNETNVYPVR